MAAGKDAGARGHGGEDGVFRSDPSPRSAAIWFIIGAFSLVLTGYFTFLRTFIDEVGIGSVGLFFAFYAGTAIALRLAFAWLPARVVRRRPSALALAAAVVMAAATVIYWHWDRRYDYEDRHEDVPAPAG